ncbi:glycine cleavage system protein GcvH [Gracilibacillus marinus]|uniref:Glycine cleavage system H protein n=1 Tax=Gracilibacillus marinus TaxID=630535 RepID=A0ABV8VTS3_9BACI
MNLPKERLYSDEHEWVLKNDTTVRIGITDHAQSELGDIVFIELPEIGDEVVKGEPFGNAESVKTVSELYSPISGKVVAVNQHLLDNPELVNESPYEEAWMIDVEVADSNQLEELKSADEYDQMINEE